MGDAAMVRGMAMLIGNASPSMCLVAAAFFLHISHSDAELQIRQRGLEMHDAVIEQPVAAEQLREMQRDN